MIAAHRILRRLRPELFKVELRAGARRTKRTKTAIAPTVRAAVLERDGNRCCRCGTGEDLTLHHIKLRKDGGKNVAENLITLCRPCHDAEHGTTKRKCNETLH